MFHVSQSKESYKNVSFEAFWDSRELITKKEDSTEAKAFRVAGIPNSKHIPHEMRWKTMAMASVQCYTVISSPPLYFSSTRREVKARTLTIP